MFHYSVMAIRRGELMLRGSAPLRGMPAVIMGVVYSLLSLVPLVGGVILTSHGLKGL
jgi:hypothetical protein